MTKASRLQPRAKSSTTTLLKGSQGTQANPGAAGGNSTNAASNPPPNPPAHVTTGPAVGPAPAPASAQAQAVAQVQAPGAQGTDTVDRALKEVIDRRLRARFVERLASGKGFDWEVLEQAWGGDH